MNFKEFLASELTYRLPAPGGSIRDRRTTTSCDADAYLASVAALVKNKRLPPVETCELLLTKMFQVQRQEHFGVTDDVAIIDRLAEWIRELAH